MNKQRVLDALNTLRAELADAPDLPPASRAQLEIVTDDIERQVQAIDGGDPPTGADSAGRLQDAVQEFGAEHPQITGAVNQVAAALANLGI